MELTPFLNFQLSKILDFSDTCLCQLPPRTPTPLQQGETAVHLELYPSTLATARIRINVTYGQAFRED